MDILITCPESIADLLNKYQDCFLPQSWSQILRAQFAYIVQPPNESVQKVHTRMRVLYHLAYPDQKDRSKVFLIEKFIAVLNNQEVQNHVRCRNPETYAKALNIVNEETSFILIDLATHAPGGLQAPMLGDSSLVAFLRGCRPQAPTRNPGPKKKWYYCDE